MYKGKAVIAVMPLYDDNKKSYWMLPEYMKCIEEAGAIPLMPSLCAESDRLDYYMDTCDGFLLTGGHDVEPSLYGEIKRSYCGETSPLRDKMDGYILKKAVEEDKAVLGICRGIQLMNAVYGGTLYQDLEKELPSKLEHHMSPPYDRGVHKVNILRQTPLYSLLNREELYVNSYHHQGIKGLSHSLEPMAVSEDGLVEAAFMPDKKCIWGVQWHPEFCYRASEENRKIIEKFVLLSINK